jgi:endonuclease V-like protein UPF0215 family
MKLVREKVREKVELKPEPKPVVLVHTVQPDVEKIREEMRNELHERLRQEREEWAIKYDAELNQLKDVIHYNTMKILHEMASQLDELEKRLDCSDKY